jgi:hypothetical protein
VHVCTLRLYAPVNSVHVCMFVLYVCMLV